MVDFFWVFIGGGIGSIARYGVSTSLANWSANFPVATLVANALACILLGFVTEWSLKEALVHEYRLFIMTGICGGFSTFSTFSSETLALFNDGHPLYAFLNIIGSVSLCILCIYLGMRWAR